MLRVRHRTLPRARGGYHFAAIVGDAIALRPFGFDRRASDFPSQRENTSGAAPPAARCPDYMKSRSSWILTRPSMRASFLRHSSSFVIKCPAWPTMPVAMMSESGVLKA
jgi:hypothetical protein